MLRHASPLHIAISYRFDEFLLTCCRTPITRPFFYYTNKGTVSYVTYVMPQIVLRLIFLLLKVYVCDACHQLEQFDLSSILLSGRRRRRMLLRPQRWPRQPVTRRKSPAFPLTGRDTAQWYASSRHKSRRGPDLRRTMTMRERRKLALIVRTQKRFGAKSYFHFLKDYLEGNT